MPPIVQINVHTKVTVVHISGRTSVVYMPCERHLVPNGARIIEDRDGVMHFFNPDQIEKFSLEHVDPEVE